MSSTLSSRDVENQRKCAGLTRLCTGNLTTVHTILGPTNSLDSSYLYSFVAKKLGDKGLVNHLTLPVMSVKGALSKFLTMTWSAKFQFGIVDKCDEGVLHSYFLPPPDNKSYTLQSFSPTNGFSQFGKALFTAHEMLVAIFDGLLDPSFFDWILVLRTEAENNSTITGLHHFGVARLVQYFSNTLRDVGLMYQDPSLRDCRPIEFLEKVMSQARVDRDRINTDMLTGLFQDQSVSDRKANAPRNPAAKPAGSDRRPSYVSKVRDEYRPSFPYDERYSDPRQGDRVPSIPVTSQIVSRDRRVDDRPPRIADVSGSNRREDTRPNPTSAPNYCFEELCYLTRVEDNRCPRGRSCRSVHPPSLPVIPSAEVDLLIDKVRTHMKDCDRKKKLLLEIPRQMSSRGR